MALRVNQLETFPAILQPLLCSRASWMQHDTHRASANAASKAAFSTALHRKRRSERAASTIVQWNDITVFYWWIHWHVLFYSSLWHISTPSSPALLAAISASLMGHLVTATSVDINTVDIRIHHIHLIHFLHHKTVATNGGCLIIPKKKNKSRSPASSDWTWKPNTKLFAFSLRENVLEIMQKFYNGWHLSLQLCGQHKKDCVMTTLWCSVVIWSQENTMENVAWREVAGSGKQEICFWSWSQSRGFFAPRLKPQHEPLSSVLAETNMLENWPRTHGYCMSFDFQSCWSTPFPPTGIFALGRVHLRLGKFAFSFA